MPGHQAPVQLATLARSRLEVGRSPSFALICRHIHPYYAVAPPAEGPARDLQLI